MAQWREEFGSWREEGYFSVVASGMPGHGGIQELCLEGLCGAEGGLGGAEGGASQGENPE